MRSKSILLITIVTLSLLTLVSQAQKDLYAILQIPRSATDDEVKKSFKKLARKFHPDAQKGLSTDAEREAARKKFMEISDAYEVLGDTKKRAAYDNSGGHRGAASAGDDRNFLRHNLFRNDFEGDELQNEELERIIQGKDSQSTLVFFWSSEIPDCIDPGLDYKLMAARLKGSSVRVGAFNCDNWFHACKRQLGLPSVTGCFLPRRHRAPHVLLQDDFPCPCSRSCCRCIHTGCSGVFRAGCASGAEVVPSSKQRCCG